MRYRSLEDALLDLEHAGMLSRVKTEVDPLKKLKVLHSEQCLIFLVQENVPIFYSDTL